MMSSGVPLGDQVTRFGKCQARKKVASALPFAGTSTSTVSEPKGMSSAVGGRGSRTPSAEKSSQKSRRDVPHPAASQEVRLVPRVPAAAARAIVPQASCFGSTPSEDMRSPRRPSVERNSFRFFLGPEVMGSFFQSRVVPEPSAPMKLGSVPQTAARSGRPVLLMRTKRSMATGMPLASASPGIRGLKASRRTSTGESGSERSTWPSG